VALLELRRPGDALASLNRSLEKNKPTAAIAELRGRVKAQLGDHSGAIDDYSLALALKADPVTRGYRGWAYLVVEAPRLALRDFDEILKSDPTSADAHNGRASAQVKLGQYRLAVKDAEEAVRLDASARALYKASRVFALAIGRVDADTNEP